jgi:OOP family OmpA-OmpF porin
MRTKHAIIATLMLCMGMGAHAQETENNWFIQGQLGASYSLGDAGFGKLLAPAGQIAVGKYFNSTLGARLAISGWSGRGDNGNNPPTASITVPLRWTDCST